MTVRCAIYTRTATEVGGSNSAEARITSYNVCYTKLLRAGQSRSTNRASSPVCAGGCCAITSVATQRHPGFELLDVFGPLEMFGNLPGAGAVARWAERQHAAEGPQVERDPVRALLGQDRLRRRALYPRRLRHLQRRQRADPWQDPGRLPGRRGSYNFV